MATRSTGDGSSSLQTPDTRRSSHQKRVPIREQSLDGAGLNDSPQAMRTTFLTRRGGGKNVVCRHPDILRAIHRAGFYGASFIHQLKVDHHLIAALVERWQPETHTFHLSVGEATITLQDIEIISGLPVDGLPVSGIACAPYSTDDPAIRLKWHDIVEKLLGFRPSDSDIYGNKINLKPIVAHFTRETGQLPVHIEDQLLVDRLARCYIMILIGGSLLPETTGHGFDLCFLTLIEDLDVAGTYSWGGAVLANLYRDMSNVASGKTKCSGGSLHIIQIWAYMRLLCIRPTRPIGPPNFQSPNGLPPPPVGYYWTGMVTTCGDLPGHSIVLAREQLDRQTDDQMVWEPYNMNEIDPYYMRGRHTSWLAKVPMHRYSTVKWHYPDRVLRQCGRWQHCPVDLPSETTEKRSTMRSKQDWRIRFAHLISLWERRVDHLVHAEPFHHSCWGPYMTWYKSVTHVIVQRSRSGSHTSQYEPSAHIISALGKSLLAMTKYVGSQRGQNPEATSLYIDSLKTLRNHGFELGSNSDSDVVDEEVDLVQEDVPTRMSQGRAPHMQKQYALPTQQIRSRQSGVTYEESSEHGQSSDGVTPDPSRETGYRGEEARFYRNIVCGETGDRYDGPMEVNGLPRYYQNSILADSSHCICHWSQEHWTASSGHVTHDPYAHTPLVKHGFYLNSGHNDHLEAHVEEERETCAIVLTPGFGDYIPYIAPTDKSDSDF